MAADFLRPIPSHRREANRLCAEKGIGFLCGALCLGPFLPSDCVEKIFAGILLDGSAEVVPPPGDPVASGAGQRAHRAASNQWS